MRRRRRCYGNSVDVANNLPVVGQGFGAELRGDAGGAISIDVHHKIQGRGLAAIQFLSVSLPLEADTDYRSSGFLHISSSRGGMTCDEHIRGP